MEEQRASSELRRHLRRRNPTSFREASLARSLAGSPEICSRTAFAFLYGHHHTFTPQDLPRRERTKIPTERIRKQRDLFLWGICGNPREWAEKCRLQWAGEAVYRAVTGYWYSPATWRQIPAGNSPEPPGRKRRDQWLLCYWSFFFPFPSLSRFSGKYLQLFGFFWERRERRVWGFVLRVRGLGVANCRGVSASFSLSYRWWCNPRTPRGWILCSITILPILFLVNYKCENLNHVQSKR